MNITIGSFRTSWSLFDQIEWPLVAEAGSKETSDGQFDVLAKVYRIF